MNKICVYAIAKNEAKNVHDFVKNMGEADAIVVLDTGSSDATVAMLKREEGVIVGEKSYGTFRFDTARNDAMQLVPKDCNILVAMDLDERLDPGWADYLRTHWDDKVHCRARYLVCHGNEKFGRAMNWVHSRGWVWKYPIHETLVREEGVPITATETLNCLEHMTMRHFPDNSKSRDQYHGMMWQRLQEYPEDASCWNYWIRHCAFRGESREILKNVDEIERLVPIWNNPKETVCLYNYIGDAYMLTGSSYRGAEYLQKAIDTYPKSRRAYLSLAIYLIGRHEFDKALGVLKACERDSVHDMTWTWLDTKPMWTWQLPYYMAVCHEHLKNRDEAMKYITAAREADNTNSVVNREYRKIRGGK